MFLILETIVAQIPVPTRTMCTCGVARVQHWPVGGGGVDGMDVARASAYKRKVSDTWTEAVKQQLVSSAWAPIQSNPFRMKRQELAINPLEARQVSKHFRIFLYNCNIVFISISKNFVVKYFSKFSKVF